MKKPVSTTDLKKTYCSLNNKIKNIQNKIFELNTNNTSEETKKQLEELNNQLKTLKEELKNIGNDEITITEESDNEVNPIKTLKVNHNDKLIYSNYIIDPTFLVTAINRIESYINNSINELVANEDNVFRIELDVSTYRSPIDISLFVSNIEHDELELVDQKTLSDINYALYQNQFIVPKEAVNTSIECIMQKINWYSHNHNTIYNSLCTDIIYIKNKSKDKKYTFVISYDRITVPSILQNSKGENKYITSGDIVTDDTWSLMRIGSAVSHINEQVKISEPIPWAELFTYSINLTNIDKMFSNQQGVTQIFPNNFPDRIVSMNYILSNCINLTKVDSDFINVNCGNLKSVEGCFSGCINLEGESPSLTYNNQKYKLWELTKVNGYPVNIKGRECFKGCTKLIDYDQIPVDWK